MNNSAGYRPVIIIPGLGQSKSFEVDGEGNRLRPAWPLTFDPDSIKKKLALPALRMLVTRLDLGFTDALAREVAAALDTVACRPDGSPKHKIETVTYDGPVIECPEEEKQFIYGMVPVRALAEQIGEDRLFYFAYNIFGNVSDTVNDLDRFIEKVLMLTGSDKVNLVAVSMGGTVTALYMHRFGSKELIDRVVGIVPAYDGSVMVSDILRGKVNLGDYRAFFGLILGQSKGEKFSKILSLVPKRVIDTAMKKTIAAALETVILNCPTMWGLVPAADYPELSEKYLSAPEKSALRAVTDEAYSARRDFPGLIARSPSTSFFTLCGYDKPIFPAVGDGSVSSDTIVHTASASMGAVVAPPDGRLPAEYCRKRRAEGARISPDGRVDASAGALPDTTWYYRKMEHDSSAGYEPLLDLARLLLTDSGIKSVDDTPQYPQFSEYTK